ncbi:hypothetical protein HAX54_036474 [Datura stramonium]|uniref:Uncharacterized protein n=1 Tax=Datura stramonium TaxID=4076 RepID=A0ABS8VKS1_DATST|nr:hypothetical protein [Datura stramonium]
MSTILDSLAISPLFSSNLRPALRPSPPLSATWDRRFPLKFTGFSKSYTPFSNQVSLVSSSKICRRTSSVSGETSDVAFDGVRNPKIKLIRTEYERRTKYKSAAVRKFNEYSQLIHVTNGVPRFLNRGFSTALNLKMLL